MNRMKSYMGRLMRFLALPFERCLLVVVNPVLERRDSQMLVAIQNMIRAEMDARLAPPEPVAARHNEIVQSLSEMRDSHRRSHSELMKVPVEEMRRTLDSLVRENQGTMEELQLTLDSLIREVVRVEGRTAKLQSAFEESDEHPNRRGHAAGDDGATLLVDPGGQSIRSINLQRETLSRPS